jgi:hypothetical protein
MCGGQGAWDRVGLNEKEPKLLNDKSPQVGRGGNGWDQQRHPVWTFVAEKEIAFL